MSDVTSDDGGSGDDDSSDTDGWDAAAEPTTGSTPRIAEPVPRSRLVGLMAEPLSRWVPLRRSTVLMLVAFLTFGTLTYLYPPNGSTTGSPATGGGISGTFIPLVTTPTTHPATTTTTSRSGGAEATTTSTTTTTTTTIRPSSTTTTTTSAPVSSTTTTIPRGSTTTSATSGASTSTSSVP